MKEELVFLVFLLGVFLALIFEFNFYSRFSISCLLPSSSDFFLMRLGVGWGWGVLCIIVGFHLLLSLHTYTTYSILYSRGIRVKYPYGRYQLESWNFCE